MADDGARASRMAILAAARIGLHELHRAAKERSRLVTLTYAMIGGVLLLLSASGGGGGLLAAAGLVVLIMAMAIYRQQQYSVCDQEIGSYEETLTHLVGAGGSLEDADGTSVTGAVLETLNRSREWLRLLLREYGTRLTWVLVAAAALALASGMAMEGWQRIALQMTAFYLILSIVASDHGPLRTILAWRKTARKAREGAEHLFLELEEVQQTTSSSERLDPKVVASVLEKLAIKDGSLRTRLQMAVGVDDHEFAHCLDLLRTKELIDLHTDEGEEKVSLSDKGRERYGSLLALLEETLKVRF